MTAGGKPANLQRSGVVVTAGWFEDTLMRGAIAHAQIAGSLRACLVVACLLWPQGLVAGLPEGLAGGWLGVVEVEGGEATVRVTLRQRGQGFEIDIHLPEGPPLRAELVPSDQPQVFQVAAERRGLFGFFDGSDRSNPFDGEPLIWARSSAVGIVAYRLTIGSDGELTLLRIALEQFDQRLEMAVERRIDAASPARFNVLLEPSG